MPSFSSLSALRKYIISNSQEGMSIVGEKVKEVLREYVQNDVYDSYEPTKYKRTYELIDSITVKVVGTVGDSIMVEVYFDEDKMSHTTLFGDDNLGVEVGDNVYIPKWVDEGYTWRPNRAEKNTTNFMKDTIRELESGSGGYPLYVVGLVNYLKTKGIQVVNL